MKKLTYILTKNRNIYAGRFNNIGEFVTTFGFVIEKDQIRKELLKKNNEGGIIMKQIIILNDKVIASDPCYNHESSYCSRLINEVLPGEWECKATRRQCGTWGLRVTRLTIRHKSYPKQKIDELYGACPVDSGQCGFFDMEYYERNCILTMIGMKPSSRHLTTRSTRRVLTGAGITKREAGYWLEHTDCPYPRVVDVVRKYWLTEKKK